MSRPRSAPGATAAAWFARQQAGALSRADRDEFDAWLDADADHRQAYDEVCAVWSAIDAVRLDPEILKMREAAVRRATWMRRLTMARRAVAAGLVAAIAVGWISLNAQGPAAQPVLYSTRTGQTSTFALTDGSRVTLDTNSAVKVWPAASERRLELLRGRAFFEVAKDQRRPFVVHVDRGSVTALGTAFDVRKRPGGMKVVLAEGRLRVLPVGGGGRGAMEMSAGQQVINQGSSLHLSQTDAAIETSWRRGTLVFEEEPLGAVIDELNRYSTRRIEIADPAVARHPVSAVLRTDDAASFLDALQSMKLVRVVKSDATVVVLSSR